MYPFCPAVVRLPATLAAYLLFLTLGILVEVWLSSLLDWFVYARNPDGRKDRLDREE
jgi:hypothetical protein